MSLLINAFALIFELQSVCFHVHLAEEERFSDSHLSSTSLEFERSDAKAEASRSQRIGFMAKEDTSCPQQSN